MILANLPNQPEVSYRMIDGYPGYAVGDDGSVWSCRIPGSLRSKKTGDVWRKLAGGFDNNGYLIVVLSVDGNRKTRNIHRLVLETFVGPCPDGCEVAHGNGVKSNNCLSNLRWATRLENANDRHVHGTVLIGTKHPRCKLTEDGVRSARKRFANGESQASIARELGVSQSSISLICKRVNWSHIL
jgi:hypothetical protein